MPKFIFKVIINGSAFFPSVIGLYFVLGTFPSMPYVVRLLLTALIGGVWLWKLMMYFRSEILKLIASNLKGKDLTKVTIKDILS